MFMNRIIPLWLCFLFLTCVSVSAQELRVDKVTLLETDNEAETNPRYDGNGEICALLKVYVNELSGLKFASGYIIGRNNIMYKDGYYTVYVADGIRNIKLSHGDYIPTTLNFTKDFQISIIGGKTYRVDVSTVGIVKKTTQTVAFNMIPREGSIVINGEKHLVSKGILQLELKPGNYSYTASADYFQTKEGTFTIKDEDISEVREIPLSLKPIMANVNFTCNVPTAQLYINNSNKGEPGMKSLPMGKHRIRVKAEDWKDYSQEIIIDRTEGQELVVTMQPKSVVSIIVKVNGTSTPFLYIDNKEVKGWKNGRAFQVRTGRHLITVTNGDLYNASTKEKTVRVVPNMEVIEFSF